MNIQSNKQALDLAFKESVNAKPVRQFPVVRLKSLKPFVISFLLMVVVPALLALFYFAILANPIYESTARVAVRKDSSSTGDEIGVALGSPSALATFSDSFIVTNYTESREMVEALRRRINLVAIFKKGGMDPFYQISDDPSVEELLSFWNKMTDATFDASTGIIEINVRAFSREDVVAVSDVVTEVLTDLVDKLAERAQQEAVKFSSSNVEKTLLALELSRVAINKFRAENETVNPQLESDNLNNQINVLAQEIVQLQTERLVKRRLAPDNLSAQDQLDVEIQERKNEIQRIKQSLNEYGSNKVQLPVLLRQYEALISNLTIAQERYQTALEHLDTANAVAALRRAHLYVFVEFRRPEKPIFPNQPLDFLQIFMVLLGVWGIYRMLA